LEIAGNHKRPKAFPQDQARAIFERFRARRSRLGPQGERSAATVRVWPILRNRGRGLHGGRLGSTRRFGRRAPHSASGSRCAGPAVPAGAGRARAGPPKRGLGLIGAGLGGPTTGRRFLLGDGGTRADEGRGKIAPLPSPFFLYSFFYHLWGFADRSRRPKDGDRAGQRRAPPGPPNVLLCSRDECPVGSGSHALRELPRRRRRHHRANSSAPTGNSTDADGPTDSRSPDTSPSRWTFEPPARARSARFTRSPEAGGPARGRRLTDRRPGLPKGRMMQPASANRRSPPLLAALLACRSAPARFFCEPPGAESVRVGGRASLPGRGAPALGAAPGKKQQLGLLRPRSEHPRHGRARNGRRPPKV